MKAEHAGDLDSGALVAVTQQGAEVGDTTSLGETVRAAAEQVEAAPAASAPPPGLTEIRRHALRRRLVGAVQRLA
jgi:transposase